jgi:UDP-N-acetylmuramoyl-tripeptide--D-alanyl-D-alanine ligase
VSFGHGANSEARILSKTFDGSSWQVAISLEGDCYEYNVPFVEEFAPINSLMVLSAVHYLGLDVETAIATLASYLPFETHGGIFQLQHQGKPFTLYDQSYRGKYQPFISFFKTIKNINADTGGRRILIMSQIVDDRDFKFFDFDEFIALFKAANIDSVYTVDQFKVHAHIIDESTQWVKHGDSSADIVDDVIQDIQANDTVFIKGVHSSGLYKLAGALKDLAAGS